MRQSRFAWFGVVELLLAAALLAVFGPVVLTTTAVVPLVVVSGILAILAARYAVIEVAGVSVTWRSLVGASYLAFAVMWPLIYGPTVLFGDPVAEDYLMFVVAVVSAGCFLFFGIDIARGGRHFDVTGDVDRVLSL
ncbi:hypothetical protein [Halorubellus litoreus]|uniref:SPW repeat-containing protein n=1 Tax=Halorubellus litoreus TaxID=755308 RepID=A0ABD5VCV9_9EURY